MLQWRIYVRRHIPVAARDNHDIVDRSSFSPSKPGLRGLNFGRARVTTSRFLPVKEMRHCAPAAKRGRRSLFLLRSSPPTFSGHSRRRHSGRRCYALIKRPLRQIQLVQQAIGAGGRGPLELRGLGISGPCGFPASA